MFCIETSILYNISLGSLQKFEGATGEFKRALGSWYPLISSPGCNKMDTVFVQISAHVLMMRMCLAALVQGSLMSKSKICAISALQAYCVDRELYVVRDQLLTGLLDAYQSNCLSYTSWF